MIVVIPGARIIVPGVGELKEQNTSAFRSLAEAHLFHDFLLFDYDYNYFCALEANRPRPEPLFEEDEGYIPPQPAYRSLTR